MHKVLLVFGTRPEAIKMAPLVRELLRYPEQFQTRVCVTAQHRAMLDQVLSFFEITPDYDLNLMTPDQDLNGLTASVVTAMKPVLEDFKPDFVMVQGDTTTTFAAALAAFYLGIKVCHVEAGLRTNNKLAPFPEEVNRRITSVIADYHFAPTESARENLLRENIPADRILVTGNTVVDALLWALEKVETADDPDIDQLKQLTSGDQKIVLVTGHRRENFGDGFENICRALKEIARDENVRIIYPVHLNPRVQTMVHERLSGMPNIHLLAPLSYPAFIWLMKRSYMILTDSGGIQEEAPSIGKPVLVMREATERREAMDSGNVLLVGTDSDKIISACHDLLHDPGLYGRMSKKHNPYGNGEASGLIVQFLKNVTGDE
jgi:UDP-N-acetylglucosamine 2-epimerase (non-hydrolysing)